MKGDYQAAFIVPKGASKVLGEDGWEFNGVGRLPGSVGDYLVRYLGLEFVEEYFGIRRYTSNQINMSIFFDSADQIESIYFQVFYGTIISFSEACESEEVTSCAEIFIPER
ncbi:hypothetical protein [Pseudomonas syringae group genomosp. 3]|uniref:hypothetical protein n=1 Tax=Pseudomonas syringae group genomosp. 3 TaxID=251701 RepID=UPI00070E94E9|nr:hypothetical protein [Pseudomonas syringae group genomosp. 3]